MNNIWMLSGLPCVEILTNSYYWLGSFCTAPGLSLMKMFTRWCLAYMIGPVVRAKGSSVRYYSGIYSLYIGTMLYL